MVSRSMRDCSGGVLVRRADRALFQADLNGIGDGAGVSCAEDKVS